MYCHCIGNCNSCIALTYLLQLKDTTDATVMTDATDTKQEGDKVAEQKEAHLHELDELTATYEGWSATLCGHH